MNEILCRSVRIYQKLLALYPEDLRREFGHEMVLAFADDLAQAWGDARWAGIIQIWWYAIRELLTVALPGQMSNPYILSPALAFLFAALTETAFVCLGIHQARHVDGAVLADAFWLVVVFPSLINAFVAFLVTCFCARCSMNVLRLD